MTILNGAVNRREFLIGTATALAATTLRGQGKPALDPEKMKRIAVMSLSLNSIVKSERNPTGTVDAMNFPEVVADHLGIHNVELDVRTFFTNFDPSYVADFRKVLDKTHSQVSQIIMTLGTLTPTPAELKLRYDAIDHAVMLGCPRVMVLTGNSLAPATRQTTITALKGMADYAKTKNVFITMENFNIYSKDGFGARPGGAVGASGGGAAGPAAAPAAQAGPPYSAPWDELLEVCAASGTYINPDTGNFFDNVERMKGLPLMYPKSAGSGHVKFAPDQYDTGECIRISKRVGYKGIYSIEANGGGGRGAAAPAAPPADPFAACINIRDIILANM